MENINMVKMLGCGDCGEKVGTITDLTQENAPVHGCFHQYESLHIDVQLGIVGPQKFEENKQSGGKGKLAPKTKEENVTTARNPLPMTTATASASQWSEGDVRLLICCYTENEPKFASPQHNKNQFGS